MELWRALLVAVLLFHGFAIVLTYPLILPPFNGSIVKTANVSKERQIVAAPGTINCYACGMFEGITVPGCLNPATRGSFKQNCDVSNGGLCFKMVYNIFEVKDGQVLKTRVLYRGCSREGSPFLGFTPCGTCGSVSVKVTIYPKQIDIEAGRLPELDSADESTIAGRNVCTCCTELCNAEDGFDLRQFLRQTGCSWWKVQISNYFYAIFFVCAMKEALLLM